MKRLLTLMMITGSFLLCLAMVFILVAGVSFIGYITTEAVNQWTIRHACYIVDYLHEIKEGYIHHPEEDGQNIRHAYERLDDHAQLPLRNLEDSDPAN